MCPSYAKILIENKFCTMIPSFKYIHIVVE